MDCSKDFLFSLSVDTKKLIGPINEPILIEVLDVYKKEDIGHSLLNEISRINKNIRVHYIDIYKISREKKEDFTKGTIRFLQSSGSQIELLPRDLWGNQGESLHEQKISRTLKVFLQSIKNSPRRLIFLKGSGERRISDHGPNGISELARLLKTCGFLIDEWELSSESVERLLKTDLLVIPGPRQKLSPLAKSLLVDQVVNKKRNVLLFLDPVSDSGFQEVGVKDIFNTWGVSYQDGLIVDRENFAKISGSAGSIFFPILSIKSPIFSNFMQRQFGQREYGVAFFSGRSIVVENDAICTPILETSSRAYEERSLESLKKSMLTPQGISSVFYDAGVDKEGPLIGGVSIHTDSDQRMVCLGDSGLAANRVIRSYDHVPFLLSCFLWSAKKEFLLQSAPHKNTNFPRFIFPIRPLQILYLVRCGLIPLLPLLIFFCCRWYGNRKRRGTLVE